MPRMPFLKEATTINLTIEKKLKAEAHIYAANTRVSLSQEFVDYITPKIVADKLANPARYRAFENRKAKPMNSLNAAAVSARRAGVTMTASTVEEEPEPGTLSPA